MNKYYVYIHVNNVKQEPFYVGKGCQDRAYSKSVRSQIWLRTVSKYGYDAIVLFQNLSQENALKKEIELIKQIGRRDLKTGPLVNLTDGGDGNNNFSFETRKIISDKAKLRPSPNKGKRVSDNTKLRISQTLKDKYISGEWIPNVSGLHTLEAKAKSKAGQKGKTTWNKGKTNIYSSEVRANISKSLLEFNAIKNPINERVKKKKDRMKIWNKENAERKKQLAKKYYHEKKLKTN